MRQRAQLPHELDAVELGQLVVGENHVDAVGARVLQRPARRVEELEVELAVDLPDDLREQQPAAEEIVDDDNGVALCARKRELGDDAALLQAMMGETHTVLSVPDPGSARMATSMSLSGCCCSPAGRRLEACASGPERALKNARRWASRD